MRSCFGCVVLAVACCLHEIPLTFYSLIVSTVTIEVTASPPPVAVDDSATTLINTAVGGDLLDNDYDPEGNPLTVNTTPISGPTNGGDLTINPDGTYTYNPVPGFTGTVTFVYEIYDGNGNTDQATGELHRVEAAALAVLVGCCLISLTFFSIHLHWLLLVCLHSYH